MMAAMKRHFLFFAAVFFLAAKATSQSLPQEILSETQAVYEWTESDDGRAGSADITDGDAAVGAVKVPDRSDRNRSGDIRD